MSTTIESDERGPASARFAWLTLLIAAWITGGLLLVATKYASFEIVDTVVSLYHVPFYLGVLALAVGCLVKVVRAMRAGRSWRSGFPRGYAGLAVGALLLVVWPVIELGWREGIGIRSLTLEQVFAPSRLVAFGGIMLVASAPLYGALKSRPARLAGWTPALSAALMLSTLGLIGYQPAQNPWLESPLNDGSARSEIWVMDSDGSHQTMLISLKAFDLGNAVWSPDGTRIAYTMSATPLRTGLESENVAIWTADADGRNQRKLVAGVGWYWLPHWSPDGEWVLFTLDGQRGPGSGAGILPPDVGFGQPPAAGQPTTVTPNVDVWRIRSDGTGEAERVTSDPAEDRAGALSPDGRYLVFDSTRDEGHTAVFVGAVGSPEAVQVTTFDDAWGASWSPDGSAIAFHGFRFGASYDIYVTSFPANGEPRQLTFDLSQDRAPSWSPDGSRIAFESDREGANDVWAMAAGGGSEVNLTATENLVEALTSGGQAWGPDGRIVFSRSRQEPASATPLVRENLGVIAILLGALLVAFLVMLVAAVGAPFGAVAVILALGTAAAAIGSGEWRFVPAAVVAGLIVDVLVRLAAPGQRHAVAAAGAGAAFVLAAGATILVTSVIGWSVTMLLGVAGAAGALGWAMAVAYRSINPPSEAGTVE